MTTKLVIQESSELTSLHLGHCTALRKLEIKDCESLALIEGFQSITNLMSFTVAAFSCLPPWMELLLQQQEAYEILSRLTNLEIGDASILTVSLCKQLTSLQYLEFNGKKRARW
jgi:Leucine-rich repeat (LRR) protein